MVTINMRIIFCARSAALLVYLFLIGCSVHYTDGIYSQLTGKYFSDENVNKIIIGHTSANTVTELLGESIQKMDVDKDTQILIYHSTRQRISSTKTFLSTKYEPQTVSAVVIIRISSGIVTDIYHNN